MKKNVLFLILFLSITQGTFSQKASQSYIPDYKGIFTSPAILVPTAFTPDAPIAGNGDVGIVFTGTPDKQCIYISKNDFWKAQSGYPEGGLCLPGGLKISIPELEGASFYAEQILANGNINAVFVKDGLTCSLKTFVPAGKNIIVIELSALGNSCNVSLDLWSQSGFDSRNESGEQDGVFYTMRHFDSPGLDWPTHIAMAMKIIGAKGKSFELKPSQNITIVIGICTNHDAIAYFEQAISLAKSSTKEKIFRLNEGNNHWWKEFWSESHIAIGDTLLEKYYYGSQYLLASCSRNKNFPPGLCGNAITADAVSAWQGDYHTNYNFQAPWWACYSSNHIELTEPYDQPILDYMAKAKVHARKELNCRGVYYPVGIGPKGFCSSMYPLTEAKMMKNYGIMDLNIEGGYMFCGQRSNAVFLTSNMFQRFYHTYDKEYTLKVFPFICEVADFWEDYLKFENGQYNSYNDNFWEVGPWTENWRKDLVTGDTNNTNTLGLLKMFSKGFIEMSAFLDVDNDQVQKWKHIQQNLYSIPVVETNGMIRIKATERGNSSGCEARTKPGFGRVMAYPWVFPSDITGVMTDPVFAEILRKEIGRWDTDPGGDATWNNLGNGFETYFTTAVRLGYDPEAIITKLKARIAKTTLPNLWIPQSGGLTETLSAVPSCINEMLLQSYEGMIRVFPAWPVNRDASFENLRAYGAFLVSAEQMGGDVTNIKILSEKGRICTFKNPWPGKTLVISESGKPISSSVNKDEYTFQTEAGKTYELSLN